MGWAKYFFGSFFSNKIARKSVNHSEANLILGFILAVIILLAALICGRNISFTVSLSDSDDFIEFVDYLFNDSQFYMEISEQTASGDIIINTYANEEDKEYSINGYNLVVDLRNTYGICDDFSVVAVSPTNGQLTYEEYRTLSSEEQEDYSLSVVYSGRELDIWSEENQQKYLSYLNNVCDASSEIYNEEIAESFSALLEGQEDFEEQVYYLYVTAYYADFSVAESVAVVPTLRGYYESLESNDSDGKYLIFLSDCCSVSFASGDITFTFQGYYPSGNMTIGNGNIVAADDFIKQCYYESVSLYGVNYFIGMLSALGIALLIWLACSVVLYVVCRIRKCLTGYAFTSAMKVIGSFFLISAALASVLSLIFSFSKSIEWLYSFTLMTFIALFLIRSVLFIFIEATRKLQDIKFN